MTKLGAGLLAVYLGCVAQASAQDPAPPSDADTQAYEAAIAGVIDSLDHDQLATLGIIAHASAAAALCPGLDLVPDAVKSTLAGVESGADGDFHDQALITYGLLTGLAIAQGARDESAFCAHARDSATDPEAPPLLVISEAPPAN